MILGSGPRGAVDAAALDDAKIATIRGTIERSSVHVSALQVTQNHIAADADRRSRENAYFVKAIELAGQLGVPYIGTASGQDPKKNLAQQVDEIVRMDNKTQCPAYQKYNVRILWEPVPSVPK